MEQRKWTGITINSFIFQGVVRNTPEVFESDDGLIASMALAVKMREQDTNGQWSDIIMDIPLLVANTKKVENTVNKYITDGREILVNCFFNSWDNGHGFMVRNISLGNRPINTDEVPSPEDRKYWNICLNNGSIQGNVVGTPIFSDTCCTMNIETVVNEFKNNAWLNYNIIVPITVIDEGKIDVVRRTVNEGKHLHIETYYKSGSENDFAIVAKHIILGDSPAKKQEVDNRIPPTN